MLNPTNKVQTTNITYDTTLQYAYTAVKGIGLLAGGYDIGNYFALTPQSPFRGNTALADLTPLDNHVFSPLDKLTSIAAIKEIPAIKEIAAIKDIPAIKEIAAIKDIVNLKATSTIINSPSLKVAFQSPLSPCSKPINPSIAIKQPVLLEKVQKLPSEPLLPKIQKTASQNPILSNTAIIIPTKDAIEDIVEEYVICENEFPLDECHEGIFEDECHDELPLESNQTAPSIINDDPQCTVVAESLGSRAINLTCNVASKALDVSCRIGKCVGKSVAKGLYNYLSANSYRRPRLYLAIAAAYRCDPRVRASFTRIYRNARSL